MFTDMKLKIYTRGRHKFEKSQRLAWLGYVGRMGSKKLPKKLLHGKMSGERRRGRPGCRGIHKEFSY